MGDPTMSLYPRAHQPTSIYMVYPQQWSDRLGSQYPSSKNRSKITAGSWLGFNPLSRKIPLTHQEWSMSAEPRGSPEHHEVWSNIKTNKQKIPKLPHLLKSWSQQGASIQAPRAPQRNLLSTASGAHLLNSSSPLPYPFPLFPTRFLKLHSKQGTCLPICLQLCFHKNLKQDLHFPNQLNYFPFS